MKNAEKLKVFAQNEKFLGKPKILGTISGGFEI